MSSLPGSPLAGAVPPPASPVPASGWSFWSLRSFPRGSGATTPTPGAVTDGGGVVGGAAAALLDGTGTPGASFDVEGDVSLGTPRLTSSASFASFRSFFSTRRSAAAGLLGEDGEADCGVLGVSERRVSDSFSDEDERLGSPPPVLSVARGWARGRGVAVAARKRDMASVSEAALPLRKLPDPMAQSVSLATLPGTSATAAAVGAPPPPAAVIKWRRWRRLSSAVAGRRSGGSGGAVSADETAAAAAVAVIDGSPGATVPGTPVAPPSPSAAASAGTPSAAASGRLPVATDRPATGPSTYRSTAMHRAEFLRTSKTRILTVTSPDDELRPMRLTPTLMNGDCGYAAILKGLVLAANPDADAPIIDVRKVKACRAAMAKAVRADRAYYHKRVTLYCDSVDTLKKGMAGWEASVVRGGMGGHWLGALWGVLEIEVAARAFGVCIDMYAFDVRKQAVRCYHSCGLEQVVPAADMPADGKEATSDGDEATGGEGSAPPPVLGKGRRFGMLFSGPARSGHFDVLVYV